MPFTGIFTDIMITPGQSVKEGETIAQYDLNENTAIELANELLFNDLDDLKYHREIEQQKIRDMERREQELSRLTAENLSPQYVLTKLKVELRLAQAYLAICRYSRFVAVCLHDDNRSAS